jgi:diguanylate cyclase (GGDEF)-like protein
MGTARGFLKSMFEHRDDPYEGADLETSRRVTAALLGLSALLSLAFLPLEPVDDGAGGAGWLIAGALIVVGLVGAVLIVRREPSFGDLLVVAYCGVAGIAVLNWLAGGDSSAYEDLFVLWVGAGAVHPPRRAFTHLGAMLVALALPLAYEGASSNAVRDMIAEALILVVLGAILTSYLHYVRRQRVGLRTGAEVARRLARVDVLTGLGNRRAFDEALTIEIALAARDAAPLSVGLVDVDNLKRVNDSLGHLEGDRSLVEVARAIERGLRTTDRCFRWGGDEFVVILPNTDHRSAAQVLGRMAEEVGRVCEVVDGSTVALSWGVGEFEPDASPEDLLALADASLRDHKSEKRR